MAAQLVPCSPSVPPPLTGGTGKGKLFWELGKGPGLTWLSREGLLSWEQWWAQPRCQTKCPGWVAQEPGGASREPSPAEEGTHQEHTGTPLQPILLLAYTKYPWRGGCSTAGLSLIPSPCPPVPTPAHDTPLCAQDLWLLPARPISVPSPLWTLLQSHSLGARGQNKCQPHLPGAGGSSGLLLLSQTVGEKKGKSCVWGGLGGQKVLKSLCIQAGALPAMGWPHSPGSYWHVTRERKHNRAQQPEWRQHKPRGGASLAGMAAGGAGLEQFPV